MADQAISTIVRFDNRIFGTLIEANIQIMFDEHPFDMNLIAANEKKVPVHLFVMMMFSPYIRLTLNNELPNQPDTDVPLTDFSYEVLSDVVKYIYFGEVVVRNAVKAQFGQALQKLNIIRPSCILDDSESKFDAESDGEGYKELVHDNDAHLFDCDHKIRRHHKQLEGKMPYICETPGCKVQFFTKVVDGKTMIKVVHAVHSEKCEKQRKERTTPNEWSNSLLHLVANERDSSEKSSAERSSNASGTGLSTNRCNKVAKKGAKQSNASVAVAKEKR